MKTRLLTLLIMLLGICNTSKAQWFTGGTVGFGYTEDRFYASIIPQLGYEFNDKWAFGAGLGGLYDDDYSSTILTTQIYARRNVWNNNQFFFDIKGVTNFWFSDHQELAELGLSPSFRFKSSDKIQFAANVGLLGIQLSEGEIYPAIGFRASGTSLEIIYKF